MDSYNSAVQFKPSGGPDGIYHKRHLVPFGEFVPFQNYITFLGPVVGDLGNFDIGDCYLKLQVKGFSYTPMICYEVIFPGDVCQACKAGADALVNISNDAWYGQTASPYQHAMMGVVRAAEERKPLLRAANTGISLATDPFGRITGSTALFEENILPAEVWVAPGANTLYSRWGNWFPRLCLIITFLLVLAAIRKSFVLKPDKVPGQT
jgi:apolipoprotein N-acyltransferase